MIDLLKTVINSYCSVSDKIYTLLRFAICPFSLMEENLPHQGKIFDLGCGEGVFSQYLARTATGRQVIGVDRDKNKIEKATKAANSLKNLKFVHQDVFAVDLSGAKGVVLSDFLHHLTIDKQRRLLQLISRKLTKGGILLIKEINSKDFIRSRLSRFWDWVFYPQDKIYYRDLIKLERELEKLGFTVAAQKEVFYFPGSTNLLICKKK